MAAAKPAPDVEMALLSIGRAMTAAWLIDAVQSGELSTVNSRDGAKVPPHGWAVQPTIPGDDILEHTRHMMLEEIGRELVEARSLLTGKQSKKGGRR